MSIQQKYRLNFLQQSGLSPAINRALGQQFLNADEMFETLFTELRRVAALLNALEGSDAAAATGFWSVLTDGDLVAPELIFADGDVIMVFVPTTTS